MSTFSAEDIGFTFLEKGSSVEDFIQQKTKELSERGSLDAFFVVDLGEILRKHLRWVRAMPRVKPFYAVKCNDKHPVVKTLALLGTGFDCASQPEVELMKSLDVDPSRIIYANTIKQVSHLKYAADYGIEMMTFDTVAELDKIATHHKNAKLVLRIFADNSDSMIVLSNKFGARLKECPMLLEAAKNLGLNVIGVSFHVGSLCSNSDAYRKAIKDCCKIFDMAAKLGYSMNLVDIGGGFPGYDIPNLIVFQEFANVINKSLEKHFPDPAVQVIAEPGRYYPESSFTLATNIIGKKVAMKRHNDDDDDDEERDRMMYYVNDGLHTSFRAVRHWGTYVLPGPVKKRTLKEATFPSTIFGQTCDGHDQIVEKYPLPNLEIGEWLLFYNMGAYTVTLSTNFNGFKKPDIHYMISEEAWQRIQQITAGVMAEEANDVLDEPNRGKPGPARIRFCLKTCRPILE
ncbi:hypothetical protein GJAV_G00002140 [Gymnothorax javanicus]|nr:hypothetical protein GJAV_G00002140 [Gymnothorax javanicus]